MQTALPLEGALIPSFELPRVGGGSVRVRAYRGRRSLLLLFAHAGDCAGCRDLVAAFVYRAYDYALADTAVLVILPVTGSVIAAADLPRQAREAGGAISILLDADRAVARRYGVDEGSGALLVADRFGVPMLFHQSGAAHELPDQDELLREVEYLAHTCSAGCATPLWGT